MSLIPVVKIILYSVEIKSLDDGSDIEKRISSQEEAIQAFDAYRKQINRTVMDLQSRLNELQIRVEDSL